MSFCDHCEGQRFDRAQVLRALRAVRNQLRDTKTSAEAEHVIALAIETVRTLDIPHFDTFDDEVVDGEVIH
jgi:imidazolonepropionase-like amidohydrolase